MRVWVVEWAWVSEQSYDGQWRVDSAHDNADEANFRKTELLRGRNTGPKKYRIRRYVPAQEG